MNGRPVRCHKLHRARGVRWAVTWITPNWADRDRFVELDRAIEANAQLDEIEEPIEEPVSWSSTLDSDYTPSPFSSWGVRPIGGGHFRNNRRRRFIQ